MGRRDWLATERGSPLVERPSFAPSCSNLVWANAGSAEHLTGSVPRPCSTWLASVKRLIRDLSPAATLAAGSVAPHRWGRAPGAASRLNFAAAVPQRPQYRATLRPQVDASQAASSTRWPHQTAMQS